MPAPLAVDWNIAKQLFLSGMPLKQVAAKCSIPFPALRQKAARYRWKQDDFEVSRRVTDAVTRCHVDAACDIVKQGNAWKHRVIKLAESHLSELEKRDPATLMLEDFDVLSRIAERTDAIARKSFGLDADKGSVNVTLQVQSELPAQRQLAESNEVLEVETVPNVDNTPPEPTK